MSLAPLDGDASHLRETCSRRVRPGAARSSTCAATASPCPTAARRYREYVVHPGAVMIVPLLDDGRVVVERQWRYPMGRAMLEFPAGKLEPGEPVLDCAVRELIEETGYRAAEWARAGILHNAIAYSDEGIEIWFARGLDAGERRARRRRIPRRLRAPASTSSRTLRRRGELTDAKTLIGLLWLAELARRPLGPCSGAARA